MSYACARSECDFNFLGSWFYSKEWVWNLGTKILLHCFRKVKYKLGDTPEVASQNLILPINSYRVVMITACQWPSG